MKVYFTENFKEALQSPDRYIELGKYKLGSYSQKVSSLSEINLRYMNQIDSGKSPTDGYYMMGSIYSNQVLNLSLEVPLYDIGMLNESFYKIIYVLYTDLMTSEVDIAFLLCGDMVSNEIYPLRLSRDKNIITVPGIDPKCNLKLNSDEDTKFLEGPGVGKYYNIYTAPIIEENEVDLRYVSTSSYDSYLLENKTQDNYDHLETSYINKFGIKIY